MNFEIFNNMWNSLSTNGKLLFTLVGMLIFCASFLVYFFIKNKKLGPRIYDGEKGKLV